MHKQIHRTPSPGDAAKPARPLRSCIRCRKNKSKCNALHTAPNPCSSCEKKGVTCEIDYVTPPQRSNTMKQIMDLVEICSKEIAKLCQKYDGVKIPEGDLVIQWDGFKVVKLQNGEFVSIKCVNEKVLVLNDTLTVPVADLQMKLDHTQNLLEKLWALNPVCGDIPELPRTVSELIQENLLLLLLLLEFYYGFQVGIIEEYILAYEKGIQLCTVSRNDDDTYYNATLVMLLNILLKGCSEISHFIRFARDTKKRDREIATFVRFFETCNSIIVLEEEEDPLEALFNWTANSETILHLHREFTLQPATRSSFFETLISQLVTLNTCRLVNNGFTELSEILEQGFNGFNFVPQEQVNSNIHGNYTLRSQWRVVTRQTVFWILVHNPGQLIEKACCRKVKDMSSKLLEDLGHLEAHKMEALESITNVASEPVMDYTLRKRKRDDEEVGGITDILESVDWVRESTDDVLRKIGVYN